MKKIIIIIGVILLNIFLNIPASAKEQGTFIKEDNKLYAQTGNFELKEVSPGLMLVKSNEIKYIYKNQEICNIEEIYLAHIVDSDNLYLVSKKQNSLYLRSINLLSKKENIVILELNDCSDIVIIDNELTLFGSTNNDASITKYTKKLSFLYDYTFGGEGNESFIKGYYYNQKYYLIGLKDAHSKNSPFMDVGSQKEIKTFITCISNKGIIEDSIYFNHGETYEDIYTSSFYDGKIMISIKLPTSYQTYIIDSSLEKINYEECTNLNNQIVLSSTLDILYISNEYLSVKEDNFLLDIPGQILLSKMEDNLLKIYYYHDYYIWEESIYQYNLDRKEDIVINLFNNDFDSNMPMEELSELKVSSYIHKIELKLNSIEPYFLKQIPGDYIGHFELIINDEKSFIIDNNIRVEEYVNIYDQHIYPVGYKLKFFGYAMLDGKSIASGVTLKEVGEHTLLISDVEGKTKKYVFYIAEDYYCSQEELPPTDYTIRKNNTLEISFNSNDNIQKVYINNQETQFKQEGNVVKVTLNEFQNTGVYEYRINKVECEKGVIDVNKKFTIKVLKSIPQINMVESDTENFSLNIDFIDNDYAIRDLVFEIYSDEKLEKITHTYLNDFSFKVGNIQKDKKISIRGFLVYDVGDGVLKQVKIIDSSFFIEEDEYELFSVKRENNTIELLINTNNPNVEIVKLVVDNVDFQAKYQTTIDYQPLYISIIISIIIVLIGGVSIYYFKVFKKKKKS